ncbi:MAG: NAD(P)/FAD-dependent oxidoreductase [Lachnospiraceae bacterium]|nr:NAD(P)/FAD-dependent oxidoreductase [Lachnospiraceae bacterium]
MNKYIVIGSSIAGLAGIEILRRLDPESKIILVTVEKEIYSKCIMHFLAKGERERKLLSFVAEDFFLKNKVDCIMGKRAERIDKQLKKVILEDGESLDYDKLLLATGSHAFIPPIKGIKETKGVFAFHDLADCDAVLENVEEAKNIVILGAGLVGIDAADGLCAKGKSITIVDMKDHMMSIQLDKEAAKLYEDGFAKLGVKQIYEVSANEAISENGCIKELVLSDGRKLKCDMLIVASGVRANRELAETANLEMTKFGLKIDEHCRTSDDSIYAAGDITGRNMIWPYAAKEAKVAASNMTGNERIMDNYFNTKSTISMLGIPTMSYGTPEAPDDSYTVEIKRSADGRYLKAIHKDGKLYGAILQKDLHLSGVINQIVSYDMDLKQFEKPVLSLDYADLLVATGM